MRMGRNEINSMKKDHIFSYIDNVLYLCIVNILSYSIIFIKKHECFCNYVEKY